MVMPRKVYPGIAQLTFVGQMSRPLRPVRMPKTDVIKPLSETDAAYIAGIIDGEGCIGIYRLGSGKRQAAARLTLSLRVGQSRRDLLEYLQETTGVGCITFSRRSGNQRDAWEWAVKGRQAAEVIFAVCHFLRIKTEQAKLACVFANSLFRPIGRNKLPAKVVALREYIAMRMYALNKRGRDAIA